MAGILSPKIDIIFKKLFSDIRNKEIIQAFTASVLDIPYDSIKEISIENTELLPEDYGEKSGSVDLRQYRTKIAPNLLADFPSYCPKSP